MASALDEERKEFTLEALPFDNRTLRELPIDTEERNYVRDPVRNACFSRVHPAPLENPQLVVASHDALGLLGLDLSTQLERPEFVQYFSGNAELPGSQPASHCYCGYQFGNFAGQLGDGAAMYLGEVVNPAGERWELQLKGSGLTPYSRQADGRKVLRSSLREFLCSEHIDALGIPTTRAGTVITSDSTVMRDEFYNGRPQAECCSIVSRIAPTFLRFGSFEIVRGEDETTGRSGPSPGNTELLFTMIDFANKAYFPRIWEEYNGAEHRAGSPGAVPRVRALWADIAERTARMVAKWQLVGFCHGVLNTDNMSILGLTLDYGPFGFMGLYDPDFICNHSDDQGRYSYRNQPHMCRWNCNKLAEVWAPALEGVDTDEMLKIGLIGAARRAEVGDTDGEGDAKAWTLANDLLAVMEASGSDFTNTFRALLAVRATETLSEDARQALRRVSDGPERASDVPPPQDTSDIALVDEAVGGFARAREAVLAETASVHEMAAAYRPRMPKRQAEVLVAFAQQVPAFRAPAMGAARELMRAEDAEKWARASQEDKDDGDRRLWQRWLARFVLAIQDEIEAEIAVASFGSVAEYDAARLEAMRAANPRFILRNYIAQLAIERAEKNDFSEAQRTLERLRDPYDSGRCMVEEMTDAAIEDQEARQGSDRQGAVAKRYDSRPPLWASSLCVSCSS